MSDEPEAEQQAEIISKHVRALAEHFECVQVFCCNHIGDGRGTRTFSIGSGNYYARTGLAREWVLKQDEQSKIEVRKDSHDSEI